MAAVALAEAKAYTVPVQKRGQPGRGGRMFDDIRNRTTKTVTPEGYANLSA
ncbi:MAG: hypothetical protein LPK19_06910 [Hymenobacteraceae bacterium]|nr:hypothetical protein [Hymenobacteraceae bacterium]MDX5395932.1 hypothetical protein [Hymenobacteraceae bacterium]MDX5511990.1 hypothetical protein [Hymenobacteraceae bacterium]